MDKKLEELHEIALKQIDGNVFSSSVTTQWESKALPLADGIEDGLVMRAVTQVRRTRGSGQFREAPLEITISTPMKFCPFCGEKLERESNDH
ncbi:hypothetical protein [Microbulbifer sp. DLAB2-AA]